MSSNTQARTRCVTTVMDVTGGGWSGGRLGSCGVALKGVSCAAFRGSFRGCLELLPPGDGSGLPLTRTSYLRYTRIRPNVHTAIRLFKFIERRAAGEGSNAY